MAALSRSTPRRSATSSRGGPVLPVHGCHRRRQARRHQDQGAVLGHFAEKDGAYTHEQVEDWSVSFAAEVSTSSSSGTRVRTTRSSMTRARRSTTRMRRARLGPDSSLFPDPPGHHRRPRLTPSAGHFRPGRRAIGPCPAGGPAEFNSNSAPMWIECPQPASEQSQNNPTPEEHMATGYCLKCKEQREIKALRRSP